MTQETDHLYAEAGPHGLFTRLNRVGLLLDLFQHRCFDPFGLRFIDYSVLRLLQYAGPPYEMTPTKLTEEVLRSTGGMTQILDRLEAAELTQRSPDPDDRRRVIVKLTPKGLRLVKRANARYVEERARILDELSPAQVDTIDDGITTLLTILSKDLAAE